MLAEPSLHDGDVMPLRRITGGSSRKPRLEETLTEDSCALRYRERFNDELRFCHDQGVWLRWDGSIWRPERTGLAFHFAREMVRDLAAKKDPRALAITGKMSFAAGVEKGSRSDPAFARTADDWDRDQQLAGAPSCTIDLKTGTRWSPKPSLGITKRMTVDPAEEDKCPLWKAFLDECFDGDKALIRFLQQYLGYCLTGDTSEHALLYGYGAGGNGKSVLLNTVAGIMGDYAVAAPMDTFTASKGDRHPTDLAMLRGARFVTASETEEGRAWAEARIKLLTGGDPIRARFMRQDFFEFRPTFKLFIVGNHRPALHNVDDALRRRFNIVPFDHKPKRPDPGLENKLKLEWPAILRWMIIGTLDWQDNRLIRPAVVTRATDTYFAEQDLFGQWLEDECDVEIGNTFKWEPTSQLFRCWKSYAERLGESSGNSKSFAEAMRRRGFEHHRGTKGLRMFRGVQAKPSADRVTGDASWRHFTDPSHVCARA